MLETLKQFNVPAESWFEFFANINPIVRDELEWDLEGINASQADTATASLLEGYNLFIEHEKLFKNPEYRDMLSICNALNTDIITYDPDKYVYWKSVYEFINKLFQDVPALAVTKDSQLTDKDREQVYSSTKDSDTLATIASKIGNVDSDSVDDIVAFQQFVLQHPEYFHVGEMVVDSRTDYTRIYKRRAILKSCLKSIEFLLRRYEEGSSPNTWRKIK